LFEVGGKRTQSRIQQHFMPLVGLRAMTMGRIGLEAIWMLISESSDTRTAIIMKG
jgi:hypothetical protein